MYDVRLVVVVVAIVSGAVVILCRSTPRTVLYPVPFRKSYSTWYSELIIVCCGVEPEYISKLANCGCGPNSFHQCQVLVHKRLERLGKTVGNPTSRVLNCTVYCSGFHLTTSKASFFVRCLGITLMNESICSILDT